MNALHHTAAAAALCALSAWTPNTLADTLPAADGLYNVVVIGDAAEGEALLHKDAEAAIAALDPRARKAKLRFAGKNNLCVAYIMSKQTELARAACDEAVVSGRRRARTGDAWRTTDLRRDHAIALTNRGVLSALVGDKASAASDFERAARLGRKLKQPAHNLARLSESEDAVATVSAAGGQGQ